jgi:small-conductance mechanosensitive channel
MFSIPFLDIPVPEELLNGLGEKAAENVGTAAMQLAGNPLVLVGGIVLVIAAVLVFLFLKRIIINSVLGIAAWAILTYVFQVQLPLIPSFAVSAIFGLAGIGAMLVLKFLGML